MSEGVEIGEATGSPVSTAARVVYAVRTTETFGVDEGARLPLLKPHDAARIAERHGEPDGRALVRELRERRVVQLDPQGRLRLTPEGLAEYEGAIAVCRVEHEQESLRTRAVASARFYSLFDEDDRWVVFDYTTGNQLGEFPTEQTALDYIEAIRPYGRFGPEGHDLRALNTGEPPGSPPVPASDVAHSDEGGGV